MASGAASKVAKAVKEGAAKTVKVIKEEVAKAPKRPGTGGLNASLPVSPACKKFFGQSEMSRVDAMKQVWVYIKAHNLQDPQKRRDIIPDEKLKVFLNCKDRIDMKEIPGLLSPHFPKKSS